MKNTSRDALLILTFAAALAYFGWRLFYTLPFNWGPAAVVLGLALVAAEIFSAVIFGSDCRDARRAETLAVPPTPDELLPGVDVFIICHDEAEDLIFKTVNACRFLDYPQGQVNIWLCDVSQRPQRRNLADGLGVGYLASSGVGGRAAIRAQALASTSAPLAAFFQAGDIPTSRFLRETAPFFVDPAQKTGYVQTRPGYYNADLLQRNLYLNKNAPTDLDFFHRKINVGRMKSNAAVFTGSGALLSRQALMEAEPEAGGVLAASLKILKVGYRGLALDKGLTHSLSPENVWDYLRQRQKRAWATARSLPFKALTGLGPGVRRSFMSALHFWSFAPRFVFLISPILYGLTALTAANFSLGALLVFWLPWRLLSAITLRVVSDGAQSLHWKTLGDTILLPYLVRPVILGTLKKPLKDRFRPARTGRNSSLALAAPHLVLAALTLAAIIGCLGRLFGGADSGAVVFLLWLIYNLITLGACAVFYRGRHNHRFHARLEAGLEATVSCGGRTLSALTEDLSEGGLSIRLDLPEYLPYDDDFEVSVARGRYRAAFKARVRRVRRRGRAWSYSLVITAMEAAEKGQYLQILYDRQDLSPRSSAPGLWRGAWDLFKGLSAVPERGERRLPRIEINMRIDTAEAGPLEAVNFNYKYIMIQSLEDLPEGLTLCLNSGLRLFALRDPDLSKARQGDVFLYEIENWRQAAARAEFKNFLLEMVRPD